jgi:hypothetical protein
MKILYKWLMTNKCHNLRYELENLIRTVEVYNLLSENSENSDPIILFNDKNDFKIFKNITDTKTSYNIFIDNVHIRMEMSPKESVYSIHLKKQNTDWEFNVDENNDIVYSTPINQTYRVFVTYDVPVLNITRASGDSYINGNWDKYLYETINTLMNSINNNTEMVQFNKNYR